MDYPALLIAGPPHRGKSVLAAALSHRLVEQRRACYLFKATPDGEGHWFQEADDEVARQARDKRPWDQPFLRFASEIVANRPLPYLVDAGGRPTPEQVAAIFAHGTHALLIAGDAQERAAWRALLAAAGLPLLAEVESRTAGSPALLDAGEPLRVRLVGLERHSKRQKRQHPFLDNEPGRQLVQRVRDLFTLSASEAWEQQRGLVPDGVTAINLDDFIWERTGTSHWTPELLPPLLATLPLASPLACYGGRPNWLLAALAAHSAQPLHLFDAQYGWLVEPTLEAAEEGEWRVLPGGPDGEQFRIQLRPTRLRPAPHLRGPLPAPPRHLVLDGGLPRWLLAALVRHYAPQVESLALHEPRRPDEPIIVWRGPRAGPSVGGR